MAKYYGHKPSWKQYAGSGGNSGGGSKVLEMERQPSGAFTFQGEVYTPDPRSMSGPRTSVPTVPGRKWGSGTNPSMNMRAAGAMAFNRALGGFAMAADASAAAAAMWEGSYTWDDFEDGKLPPPFDWKQFFDPETWFPTFAEQSFDMPNGSKALLSPNGKWYAVAPPFQNPTGGKSYWVTGLPNAAWPPPGSYSQGPIVPEVVFSQNIYTDVPWDSVVVKSDGPWTLQVIGGQLTWLWGIKGYSKLDDVIDRAEYFWDWRMEAPYNNGVAPAKPAGAPVRQVGIGPTENAALHPTTRTPGWSNLPSLHVPRPYWANAIAVASGAQVRDSGEPAKNPVTDGGTQTVFPPNKPPYVKPTKPEEPPHPPGPGTKEKKARVGNAMFQFAQNVFHSVTEYGDVVDALFDAIPKDKRCKTKSLVGKSLCVWHHLDEVDVGDAIVNLAWNQFEDYVIGRGLFETNQRAARARGDPYGFRTLNSINGVGGLDAAGELYGEFSAKYVNPSKDNLKRFLSDKFGI